MEPFEKEMLQNLFKSGINEALQYLYYKKNDKKRY